MENHESLETGAVIRQLANAVKNQIDNFLSDGVVATGEVIGGIFLAGDQLLRMKQLAVRAGANFVNNSGFKIDENAARNVFSSASLREEGVEGIVTATNSLVRRHLTIRLNAVLETEELPAGIAHLATSLAHHD